MSTDHQAAPLREAPHRHQEYNDYMYSKQELQHGHLNSPRS